MENRKKQDEVTEVAELQSLGIDSRRKNDLNDKEELKELAESIKQSMYLDYKLAYSEKSGMHKEESTATVNKF